MAVAEAISTQTTQVQVALTAKQYILPLPQAFSSTAKGHKQPPVYILLYCCLMETKERGPNSGWFNTEQKEEKTTEREMSPAKKQK